MTPYVCSNFLATADDKNTCHICRQPRSAHAEPPKPKEDKR